MEGGSTASLSLAAAAVVMQFSLIVILSLGVLILRAQRETGHEERELAAVLFLAIPALGSVLFADRFAGAWIAQFSVDAWPTFSWQAAMLAAFSTDILLVSLLVAWTGGAQHSAFSPALLLLPSLALFLREPLDHLLWYLAAISIAFTISALRRPSDNRSLYIRPLAFWFVSMASFFLATGIGFATRPV